MATDTRILSSWKEIAGYTGKAVRTVQRWEHELGLPVRRPMNRAQKGMVMLNTSDVDAWMESRLCIRESRKQEVPSKTDLGITHGSLKQTVHTIFELRNVALALADQLQAATEPISAKSDLLTMLTIEVSWCLTTCTQE